MADVTKQPLPARLRGYAKDQSGWHCIDDTCEAAANALDALTAALQQISDMGPMSVDDQRWRIAREALTSATPKAKLTPQQQMAANVEPDPIYNRVGSPIQP